MTTDHPPTRAQHRWLRRGLSQPGGKLPLFDRQGQEVSEGVVRACLAAGWAEPWFANPLKPDWQVCRLTEAGRLIAESKGIAAPEETASADGDPLDQTETVDEILEVLRDEGGLPSVAAAERADDASDNREPDTQSPDAENPEEPRLF